MELVTVAKICPALIAKYAQNRNIMARCAEAYVHACMELVILALMELEHAIVTMVTVVIAVNKNSRHVHKKTAMKMLNAKAMVAVAKSSVFAIVVTREMEIAVLKSIHVLLELIRHVRSTPLVSILGPISRPVDVKMVSVETVIGVQRLTLAKQTTADAT